MAALSRTPNFDRVAWMYRWCEYLALGTLLEQVRGQQLAALSECRRGLILGDGDGRFTARLLRAHPLLRVTAVDASRRMLHLLLRRCGPMQDRLQTAKADVREYTPDGCYDLVVTHFLLDCLSTSEVENLVARVRPALAAGTVWVVSEFHVPTGLLRWPARVYIRLLYLAFRLLTGLRVSHLPDYASALHGAGFTRRERRLRCGGLLCSELWEMPETTKES